MNRFWHNRFNAVSALKNGRVTVVGVGCALLVIAAAAPESPSPAPQPQPEVVPETPRDFYNAGSRKLREGKLKEAESLFETALSSQDARIQTPSLYDLGHVRFGQGKEELKKGPAAAPSAARGRSAAQRAQEAVTDADQALAGDDVQALVAAYLRGRGARRELKAAAKVVKQALQTHGAALAKWQRASGDFKSDVELDPGDAAARTNGETMDRYIAKLIDSLRELQQAASSMANKQGQLDEKMKQLKGKIPAPDMPPGAAGDDDEDEDNPNGPQPGQKEGPTKDGNEMMTLTPEQANWLLEGFKLDTERRLPMGQQDTAEPRNRNRPTW